MSLSALALDRAAIAALLGNPSLAEVWLRTRRLPSGVRGLTAFQAPGFSYLLRSDQSEPTGLAVIRVAKDEPLAEVPEQHRTDAFIRILQVIMSGWDPLIIVPHTWKPYRRGSLISFHTNPRSSGLISRAYVETNPGAPECSYCFLVSDVEYGDLTGLSPDRRLFDRVISEKSRAIAAGPLPTDEVASEETSFDLDSHITFDITQGRSFSEWSQRLTKEQIRFVNAPLTQSMRLRGAAGTGKTLALVIKFLKTCYDRIDAGLPVRAAFLCHSFATVELVRNYILHVDERGLLQRHAPGRELSITTLHDLANSFLRYDLAEVTPISLDGQEGRVLQLELLQDIVAKFKLSEWMRFREDSSEEFRARLEAPINSSKNRGFIYDLMNEFACVIDAFGSKSLEERRAKYVRERRLAWMMPLESQDKEVVLRLYAEFRRQLRQMETISTDQMTSDFLGFLDSFRWDARREDAGYDVIFVDELHLFNRQERLTFHLLTNDPEAQPLVVMAYDPKQSPRDTFMDVADEEEQAAGSTGWKDTKLGPIESFEFEDVFRYTPQVLRFLTCLDQSFPAEDFGAEWTSKSGQSVIEDGPLPELVQYEDSLALYKSVFMEATRIANQKGKGGRSVAVLCASFDTFPIYLGAGEYKKNYLPITSRDELGQIMHAGKRFIFSMPEYVAGLQFEHVILIDVNAGELEALGGGVGAKRRFVSTIYLGASRTEKHLKIASNNQRGGPAGVLSGALQSGVLSSTPQGG